MTLLELIFSKAGEAKNLKESKETRVKKSSFHSILESELRSINLDLDTYLLRRELSSFIDSSKLLNRLGERRLKVKLKGIYRERNFSKSNFQCPVFHSAPLSKEIRGSLRVNSKSKSQVVSVNDSQFLGLGYLTSTFNPTSIISFYQKNNNHFKIPYEVDPKNCTTPLVKIFRQGGVQ